MLPVSRVEEFSIMPMSLYDESYRCTSLTVCECTPLTVYEEKSGWTRDYPYIDGEDLIWVGRHFDFALRLY